MRYLLRKRNMLLCYVSVLLLVCANNNNAREHNLGDSFTSTQSEADLFSDLDINGNGRISEVELFEFVQETGGDSLDESKEVHNAVSTVMSVLDGNKDKVLKKDDLSKYMKSLASLLPLDEVARWVAHAQQMPQDVVQSFVDNGITGYDFPELLQNGGALLEQELGIRRLSLRRRLMRGMRMKLLGMGSHPAAPELLALTPLPVTASSLSPRAEGGSEESCEASQVLIQWGSGSSHLPDFMTSNDMDFPVHKYQLYRERDQSDGGDVQEASLVQRTLAGKDLLVYEGMEMFFKDRLPLPPPQSSPADQASGALRTHTYRLVAWNVIGRSEYTVFEHSPGLLSPTCLAHLHAQLASSPLALPAPAGQQRAQARGQTQVKWGESADWEDNSSAEAALGSWLFRAGGEEVNKIIAISPAEVVASAPRSLASAASQFIDLLTTMCYILGCIYTIFKFLFVSASFVVSVLIALLRVKSLLALGEAASDQKEGGALQGILLGLWARLEPTAVWLHGRLLAPALLWLEPFMARRLGSLAAASPGCKPVATYLLGALRAVCHLVLEPQQQQVGGGSVLSAAALRKNAINGHAHPAGRLVRGAQLSSSTLSTSSLDSLPGNVNESCDSYRHCSICFMKVTSTIFKLKSKQKRHICSCCGSVFCRNCGSVDHSDFMQCQVPGRCVCFSCGGRRAGAVACDPREDEAARRIRDKTRRGSSGSQQGKSGSPSGAGLAALAQGGDSKQEGSRSSSRNSSRSNSPSPGQRDREREGDRDSGGKSGETAPPFTITTPEPQRGRPPLHAGGGSGEARLDPPPPKRSAKAKISSLFGIRSKDQTCVPMLQKQSSVPQLSRGLQACSGAAETDVDPPSMVRAATCPQQHSPLLTGGE